MIYTSLLQQLICIGFVITQIIFSSASFHISIDTFMGNRLLLSFLDCFLCSSFACIYFRCKIRYTNTIYIQNKNKLHEPQFSSTHVIALFFIWVLHQFHLFITCKFIILFYDFKENGVTTKQLLMKYCTMCIKISGNRMVEYLT